jgi:hypothetical protein
MPRILVAVLVALTGCAAARAPMPTLAAYQLASAAPPLEQNHFASDRMGVGEAELRAILAAPVFLEEHARIGVLPVRSGYAPDDGVPVESAPATLTGALEASGLFDLASELASEWPTSGGTAGLRELAARYRAEYVLLYRHRFADATRPNGLAALYATLLGAFFVPGTTVETAGVLEATLFDVKTGTLLFTVHERVRGELMAAPPAVEVRRAELQRRLVAEAAKRLAEQVVQRCQRLVASRPRGESAPVADLSAR